MSYEYGAAPYVSRNKAAETISQHADQEGLSEHFAGAIKESWQVETDKLY